MQVPIYIDQINQVKIIYNLGYETTVRQLRNFVSNYINKEKVYKIRFYTSREPLIMIPEQVFSDPRYFNQNFAGNINTMINPFIYVFSFGDADETVDYEVEYQINIRGSEYIKTRDYDVIYYAIDDMYRGHPFEYFQPEDTEITVNGEVYEKDQAIKNIDIRVKAILSLQEENNLEITPPSFIEWTRDTSTSNPNEYIYFDAYLINVKKIEEIEYTTPVNFPFWKK